MTIKINNKPAEVLPKGTYAAGSAEIKNLGVWQAPFGKFNVVTLASTTGSSGPNRSSSVTFLSTSVSATDLQNLLRKIHSRRLERLGHDGRLSWHKIDPNMSRYRHEEALATLERAKDFSTPICEEKNRESQ